MAFGRMTATVPLVLDGRCSHALRGWESDADWELFANARRNRVPNLAGSTEIIEKDGWNMRRFWKKFGSIVITGCLVFGTVASPAMASEEKRATTENVQQTQMDATSQTESAQQTQTDMTGRTENEMQVADTTEQMESEQQTQTDATGQTQNETQATDIVQQMESDKQATDATEQTNANEQATDTTEQMNANVQATVVTDQVQSESKTGKSQTTSETYATTYAQYYEENAKLVAQYPALESESAYASRRIIGKLSGNVDLTQYGAVALLVGPDQGFLLQFDTTEQTKKAYLALKEVEQLEYVELDAKIEQPIEEVKEGDTIAGDTQWDLKMLEIDQYRKYVKEKAGDTSITVCVLDTGTDATHPYLKSKILTGVSGATYEDTNGHGTHVAGIVVKCTKGLNVKILPIDGITAWSLEEAGTKLAVEQGAKVINMSFGKTYMQGLVKQDCYKGFHDAIAMALNAGVTIVAAAGNNGYYGLKIEDYYDCPAHFGVKDGIITVGSVDSSGERAFDSGYGAAVDVVAPGVDIYSSYLNHTYAEMSGTSMATPHITAIVAMMYLLNPEKTPKEIENLLKSYCEDKGTKGRDDYYGYGLPQMSRAIEGGSSESKHVWNTEYTIDREPACTYSGSKSIHCTECDMIKPGSVTSIKALGHNKVTKTVKATPKKSGSITTTCTRCTYSNKKTIYYPKTIALSKTSYTYNGKAKKPSVTVKDSLGNVIDASNYTVTYDSGRRKAGTYNVTIAFIGAYYKGSVVRTFTIKDNRPSQTIQSKNYTKAYGSAPFKVSAKLKTGDGTLSFKSSNPNVATINQKGKVTIQDVGTTTISIIASETTKYKKTTKKITLTVGLNQISLTKMTNPSTRAVKVIWEADSVADGYALQYATNSSFSNVSTISDITTNTKKVTKLKKGKRYYFRVRSYKKSSEGTLVYSAWSKASYITVRK